MKTKKQAKKPAEKKIVGDVKSFVIDRKKWYRGKGSDNSSLLNRSGKMCCLGHYAVACGLSKKLIKDAPTPLEAVSLSQGETAYLRDKVPAKRKSDVVWKTKLVELVCNQITNSFECESLMRINDDNSSSEEEREDHLKGEFAEIGIKVKFIN